MFKTFFPKSSKKLELLQKGRTVFKEIQTINENSQINETDKITKITKLLTDNKSLFAKKDYLNGDSLFNLIARYNTECLKIPGIAKKYDTKISDSIHYLATHPDLTFLIGKELNQHVNESLYPADLEDEQSQCQEHGNKCDEKNYNRNQVICNLQKGSVNNKDYITPTCIMAKSCNNPNVVSRHVDTDAEEIPETISETIPETISETNSANLNALTNEDVEELELLKEFKEKTCDPYLEDYKKQNEFEIQEIKKSRKALMEKLNNLKTQKGGSYYTNESTTQQLQAFNEFKEKLCTPKMKKLKSQLDNEMRNEVEKNNKIRAEITELETQKSKPKRWNIFRRTGGKTKRSMKRKNKITKRKKQIKHKTRSNK